MNQNPAIPDVSSVSYYLEGFLLHQRARRRSPSTQFFYERYVLSFITFLQEKNLPQDLADITPTHLRLFLVHIQETHAGRLDEDGAMRPRALHAYERALRAFWNWASEEARLEFNPFSNVPLTRIPNQWEVTTYSEEEIIALFEACDKSTHPARDRALMAVLVDAGVRAGELLGMRLQDLDTQTWTILVQGKGEKRRTVVLGVFARRELRAYLVERLKGSDRPELWLDRDGKPMTYWGLRDLFDRLKERANITSIGAIHKCRHTAATRMNREGMNPVMLQALMGHASFDTTRRYYLQVSEDDILREQSEHGSLDSLAERIRSKQRHLPRSGGKTAAKGMPDAATLLKEVRASSYTAVARKYGVSDTAIRKRLQKAGLV